MRIHNVKGGRRNPTWEQALRQGRQQTGCFRLAMHFLGNRPELWIVPEADQIEALLTSEMAQAAYLAGLNLRWLAVGSRPTRMAERYARVQWLPHLAHWTYGRPRYRSFREWTEKEKAMYHVGEREAESQIRLRQKLLRNAREESARLRKAQLYHRRLVAQDHLASGLAVREIAEVMGACEKTVRRYLAVARQSGHVPT